MLIAALNASTVSTDPQSLASRLTAINSTIKPSPVYFTKGKPAVDGYTAFGSLARGSVRSTEVSRQVVCGWLWWDYARALCAARAGFATVRTEIAVAVIWVDPIRRLVLRATAL